MASEAAAAKRRISLIFLPCPPYLSKALLWGGAVHLDVSVTAASDSGLAGELCTSLFGRRGCCTPWVAIVCFSVVKLINHEFFMIACSLLDKVPSS